MNVPLAVFGQPAVLFGLMDWVSTLLLLALVVFAIVMACRQFIKSYKKKGTGTGSNNSVSSVFVWLSVTFVSASVLLYSTPVGMVISYFGGDQLHLGYVKPVTLASTCLLLGVATVVGAGIVALLTYERKPQQSGEVKPLDAESSDDQSTASDEPKYRGTEVFSGIGD